MSDAPKHWETIVKAAAVSMPMVGKALGVIWDDSRARRLSKLEKTMQEIASQTGIEALAERLETDPVIEALFADAMDTVMRTGLESKRRLLAKVVAQAVQDDSKIEEAALIGQALRDLDAPHIRALERIRHAQDTAESAATAENKYQAGTRAAAEAAQKEPIAVIATLTRTAVAIPGTYPGGGIGVYRLSDFGRSLLEDLAAVTCNEIPS